MPFGKVTTPLPNILARAMHTRHASIFVVQIHHTLPLDTDYITLDARRGNFIGREGNLAALSDIYLLE
jgi:hypothetical protein